MQIPDFNRSKVNRMADAYKVHYTACVRDAIGDYLNWSGRNSDGFLGGIRFLTRFSHFCHGASGQTRAKKLLACTRDLDKTFYDIVKMVGEVQLNSGITQHSLKRYLYQAFTKTPVINQAPKVSDGDFFNDSHNYLMTEFDNYLYKRHRLEEFSCLALTEGVRVAAKHSIEDELSLTSQSSLSSLLLS
jgi:hypothetical protein